MTVLVKYLSNITYYNLDIYPLFLRVKSIQIKVPKTPTSFYANENYSGNFNLFCEWAYGMTVYWSYISDLMIIYLYSNKWLILIFIYFPLHVFQEIPKLSYENLVWGLQSNLYMLSKYKTYVEKKYSVINSIFYQFNL